MTILSRAVVVAVVALATMGQTRVPDPLSQAREFYNAQQYTDAIRVAGEARKVPAMAPAAMVITARAYLERFRQTQVVADLEQAREILRSVDATVLEPRDRVELFIAFGQSLYFDESYSLDDRFSAAAEQFEVALQRADLLDAGSRDRLFEWWAGALDRQAQQGAEGTRKPLYERILRLAERELAVDVGAVSATYWLAAAARGVNDLTRAIGAAAAGWVRAASLGPRGEVLRDDLNRLMQQVILPERAREITSEGDPRSTLAILDAQWQDLKMRWQK